MGWNDKWLVSSLKMFIMTQTVVRSNKLNRKRKSIDKFDN